jgi:anti-anti-sigma factor
MAELGGDDRPGVTFEVDGNDPAVATVTIGGELDIASVGALEAAVAPIIASKPDRLVLDVSRLRFADTSAIALWVGWASVVGTVELRDPPPLLRRVISAMGLDEKLQLRP